MRIHDVKRGSNRFCGPAALSAITGRAVDEIVAGFHATYPGKRVKGTHAWELNRVLDLYGLRLYGKSIAGGSRPTLAAWLRASKADRTPGRVFLLAAGNHWVVVSGRRMVCGKTKTVVSVRQYPHRRARVTEVHEVIGSQIRGTPDAIKAHLKAKTVKARVSAKRSSAVGAAKRLAAAHGITVEREDDYWLVYPPEEVDEDADPYEGDHMHWEPADVLEAVQTYVKLLATMTTPAPMTAPNQNSSTATTTGYLSPDATCR
jgi:hypothetical protein